VSETIEKLRPDRDLQCYFFRPTAIAALSQTSANGYHVSGTWRQQFDWAVIEWNRDSVFEHPTLRPLPDGDLSGLALSYRESRTNCIALDSTLFPTVDWPFLRIWANDESGDEQIYRVRLSEHKTATAGSYAAASATFTLGGSLTEGDVVEMSWLDEHYFHTITSGDSVDAVLTDLADAIEALSPTLSASHAASSTEIILTNRTPGDEGNRLGVVGGVSGAQTETWTPAAQAMAGGTSPTEWQIDLDFGGLEDTFTSQPIPTDNVRKMRWTYSAAPQEAAFVRGDFDVAVSDWTVTGANRLYSVGGLGTRRIENDSATFTGTWERSEGNYSAGSIHRTNALGSTVSLAYSAQSIHQLYFGTRKIRSAGIIEIQVDGGAAETFDLFVPGEDYLVRVPLGARSAGPHTVSAELVGQNTLSESNSFFFDFVEPAIPETTVEARPASLQETLATDWDTDHTLVLSPERVAWNLEMLGFLGRANHYAGAILFYELVNPANLYSSGTVTFTGTPVFSQTVQLVIDGTVFSRLTLTTDSNASIAQSFAYLINDGSTGVRAAASSNVLTITARALGTAGDAITLSASPAGGTFVATASGATLSGGFDGTWITDVSASPRINRAARDWHRSYFAALDALGVESTAAFSTELSHGDPSASAGIAQRYPDGSAVVLNTPAIQTNFSPTAIDYWKQVYLEMAQLQVEAGVTPWLQFGEVQWWYFPQPGETSSGMTFYDAYTTSTFQTQYGRAMHVFLSNDESIAGFEDEVEHLSGLIGAYTQAIRSFVVATYPQTRFEVLYPHDVNDHSVTRAVNYPDLDWTPSNLDVLKTENFLYTGDRKMNRALESTLFPQQKGFTPATSAHLIGVLFASEPWMMERRLARREGLESIVFWAFDQFSMVGYSMPLSDGLRRSRFFG
jgi:hypothetical protein